MNWRRKPKTRKEKVRAVLREYKEENKRATLPQGIREHLAKRIAEDRTTRKGSD